MVNFRLIPKKAIFTVVGVVVLATAGVAAYTIAALDSSDTSKKTASAGNPNDPTTGSKTDATNPDKAETAKTDQQKPKTPTAPTAKPSAPKTTSPSPSAPAPTPAPAPAPAPTPVPLTGWPTPQNTGIRSAPTSSHNGVFTSSSNGQTIANITITGRLVIRHDNVTVRDVRILGTGTYMLNVTEKSDGTCPSNVRIEHTEIDGHLGADNLIPIYGSNGCGFVFDRGYVHDVGRSSRLTNNTTISNSYIYSSLVGDSGAHRGAVGINGGNNNVIYNNVLKCSGRGCSAAIPNYGDFSPVTNLRIEHNLLSTTGGYCAYGGSLSGKPYPEGSNIDFINNHFSKEFYPTCGQFGVISGYASNVRGNDWVGNVWHESGAAIPAP